MNGTQTNGQGSMDLKAAAERIALSSAVGSFFGFQGTPAQWEKLISGWSVERLADFMLIVDEEASMKKDLALQIKRKTTVNDTRFLQHIQKLDVEASQTKRQ